MPHELLGIGDKGSAASFGMHDRPPQPSVVIQTVGSLFFWKSLNQLLKDHLQMRQTKRVMMIFEHVLLRMHG